jgi:hypothetical protein
LLTTFIDCKERLLDLYSVVRLYLLSDLNGGSWSSSFWIIFFVPLPELMFLWMGFVMHGIPKMLGHLREKWNLGSGGVGVVPNQLENTALRSKRQTKLMLRWMREKRRVKITCNATGKGPTDKEFLFSLTSPKIVRNKPSTSQEETTVWRKLFTSFTWWH